MSGQGGADDEPRGGASVETALSLFEDTLALLDRHLPQRGGTAELPADPLPSLLSRCEEALARRQARGVPRLLLGFPGLAPLDPGWWRGQVPGLEVRGLPPARDGLPVPRRDTGHGDARALSAAIEALHAAIAREGGDLLLTGSIGATLPEKGVQLRGLILVQHPFASYRALGTGGRARPDFVTFCEELSRLLEESDHLAIVRWDEMQNDPEPPVAALCRRLGLAPGRFARTAAEQNETASPVLEADTSAPAYRALCNRLGYDPEDVGATVSDQPETGASMPASRSGSRPFAGVTIAGMRHSGSTALFNLVRLGCIYTGYDVISGYSEAKGFVEQVKSSQDPAIVKTHEMRDDVLKASSMILTTKRDLRDTVASAVRRNFPLLKRIGGPKEYAKYNRMLHEIWAPYSNYEFDYEAYRKEPLAVATEIFELLGLSLSCVEDVVRATENLPVNQYETTLLSPTHITDPERTMSFEDTLAESVIEEIERNHRSWLERNGYDVWKRLIV